MAGAGTIIRDQILEIIQKVDGTFLIAVSPIDMSSFVPISVTLPFDLDTLFLTYNNCSVIQFSFEDIGLTVNALGVNDIVSTSESIYKLSSFFYGYNDLLLCRYLRIETSSLPSLNASTSVDLSSVLDAINQIQLNIDLTPLSNALNEIQTNINDLSSSSFSSLNGNGSEYLDGVVVNVFGRPQNYTVSRSYFGLVSDNSYTVFYDLVCITGEKLTVPEALLSLYIPTVIVP